MKFRTPSCISRGRLRLTSEPRIDSLMYRNGDLSLASAGLEEQWDRGVEFIGRSDDSDVSACRILIRKGIFGKGDGRKKDRMW